MRRSPLNQVSRKQRRYMAELNRVRPLVHERSGGLCEVGFPGCEWVAVHVHHRLMRSQGGDNSLDNLLDCCQACHSYGHLHPAESYERGFLLRRAAAESQERVLTALIESGAAEFPMDIQMASMEVAGGEPPPAPQAGS